MILYMINFLYKIEGKSVLKIKKENISKLSLPDLLVLMKAEQDGKVKIIIEE